MSTSNDTPKNNNGPPDPVPLEPSADVPDVFGAYTLEQAREDARKAGEGLSTGVTALDDHGLRWRPGKIYAVAGRPGEGKTTLMLELLMRLVEQRADAGEAADRGPAVFVTYEESRRDIYLRLLLRQCARARALRGNPPDAPPRSVAEHWIRTGAVPAGGAASQWHAELESAARAVDEYGREGHLAIIDGDRDGGDLDKLLGLLTEAQRHLGTPPALVVLDYYQKIRPPQDVRFTSRQEQLQTIADELRRYAKGGDTEDSDRWAVPVLVGAQVNRDTVGGQPELHNIREADDLAADAAGVLTLHRPEEKGLTVKIVKNRDGERDQVVQMAFYGTCGYVAEHQANDDEWGW